MTRSSTDVSSARELPTVAEVLALAGRHDLRLLADRARLDTSGLDFVVVHACDSAGAWWVVRVPRRAEVVESARVEAGALALVGPRLPVAVPAWQVHTPELIVYRRIVGTPAVTFEEGAPRWNFVDPGAPSPVFLESYARTIAALQAISPEDARAAGVPTTDIGAAREEMRGMMSTTRDALQPPPAVWARWQRWLAEDSLWPRHLALVHGDLHPGHMLLDEQARLVGVLDWTEVRVTDPSVDLALFVGCFGSEALAELIPRFAAAGGQTWPRLAEHAAERWAAFPVLLAAWALKTDNASVLEHARAQLAVVAAGMTE